MKTINYMKNFEFAKRVYRWGYHKISTLHSMSSGIEYTLTEGKKLRQFKDIHKGERCFIIGTGPSLKMHDLTKLVDEKKFAVNMFPLHPQFDEIKLNYYCASCWTHWSLEDVFLPILREAFRKLTGCTFFFEYSAKSICEKTKELRDRDVFFLRLEDTKKVNDGFFQTNVCKSVYWGETVVIDFCLPLAYYMGFSKIYLIGCDCDYNIKESTDSSNIYFYDKNLDIRFTKYVVSKDPYQLSQRRMELLMDGYRVVKNVFETNGRKIYNAGYGGRLEVFERVNYDDLF